MSNNPFLKSKESNNKSNNRFNFLNDEDTDKKSSFKESSNKSNRKNVEYDASQNSFTKPREPDRNINRNRDSYKPNNRRNNDYKPRQREPPPPPVIVNLDANDTNLFPELVPAKDNNKSSTTVIETSTNFKDILINVIQEEKPKENPIPPGWVQLSSVNGKTIIEYGPKTAWMISQEKLEEQQEDDPNYIMFKAVEAMKKSWDLYEREYDAINGDGAYAEKFRLPPVYGPEYDTEKEEDENEYDEDEQ
jgi:hypothetical protein